MKELVANLIKTEDPYDRYLHPTYRNMMTLLESPKDFDLYSDMFGTFEQGLNQTLIQTLVGWYEINNRIHQYL